MIEPSSRVVSWLVLAAGLSACGASAKTGSAQANQPAAVSSDKAQPESKKFDIDAYYQRELAPLAKKAFTFQKLSGESEASEAAKIVDDEGSFHLTIPLGTKAPLECFVYKREVDPAGSLVAIAREVKKSLDVRLLKTADVSLVGDFPVVFLEQQYVSPTEHGQAAGELKTMFYDHPVTPMLCMHDELGYNASFQRVTKNLAASLKVAGLEVNAPKLLEIYVDKIADQPAGFSRHVVLPGKNGGLVSTSKASTFIQRSPRDLVSSDSITTEICDKDGRLLEASYVEAEGGELAREIQMKRIGPQEYTYKGKHSGKNVSGKFKTKGKRGLSGDKALTAAVLSELLSGKSAEMKMEEYHPGLNPEAPVEVAYKVDSKEQRRIKISVGQMEMLATADDKGLMQKLEIPVGSVKMIRERVLVRGSQ